jgi:hypothetical protein
MRSSYQVSHNLVDRLSLLIRQLHRHSNVYGIDMPSKDELVAHGRTTEEIAAHIGADLVIFQTLSDLIDSCRQLNPAIDQFDCSVFTGEYVTGGINDAYLAHIQKLRNDKAKDKKESTLQPEMEQEELSNGCSGPMSTWYRCSGKAIADNTCSSRRRRRFDRSP